MKINFFKWLIFLVIVAITIGVVLLVTSKREYCIQFNADNVIVEEIYTSGKEIIELPTAPNKTGYTFKGWFKDSDSGENINDSNLWDNVQDNGQKTLEIELNIKKGLFSPFLVWILIFL